MVVVVVTVATLAQRSAKQPLTHVRVSSRAPSKVVSIVEGRVERVLLAAFSRELDLHGLVIDCAACAPFNETKVVSATRTLLGNLAARSALSNHGSS
jgi:hypothetical protein